jgi:hypothetical protein
VAKQDQNRSLDRNARSRAAVCRSEDSLALDSAVTWVIQKVGFHKADRSEHLDCFLSHNLSR